MFSDSAKNPYINMVKQDVYRQEDQVRIYMGENSVTRRLWEYEQNDFMRYIARWNPLGSEEKFLEKRGELFGETVYNSYDESVSLEDEVIMCSESYSRETESDPGTLARQTVNILGENSEAEFYQAALEEVERLTFTESVKVKSEI